MATDLGVSILSVATTQEYGQPFLAPMIVMMIIETLMVMIIISVMMRCDHHMKTQYNSYIQDDHHDGDERYDIIYMSDHDPRSRAPEMVAWSRNE